MVDSITETITAQGRRFVSNVYEGLYHMGKSDTMAAVKKNEGERKS